MEIPYSTFESEKPLFKNMKLTFTDRIALVSGAGRGIGKAIAKKLAEQGCTVICVSKNPSSCGAVADEINAGGGKAKAFAFDVSDPAQVKENVANILKEFGKVVLRVSSNAVITLSFSVSIAMIRRLALFEVIRTVNITWICLSIQR